MTLQGYNNLTKTLSFNAYDFIGEKNSRKYDSSALIKLLQSVSEDIGARVLNISKQNYDNLAASVNLLIAEDSLPERLIDPSCNAGSALLHLDKSHITAHTYPDFEFEKDFAIIRTDIDVSTCGVITPLVALDRLLEYFKPAIAQIDYRIRGVIKGENGEKIFIDHELDKIQDYIKKETLDLYDEDFYSKNSDIGYFYVKLISKKMLFPLSL